MFWTNYEYLCRQKGMSPNAVAREVGSKSSGSVTAWKVKGALPRQSTLNAIAKFFGVDANELVYADLTKTKEPIPEHEDELDKFFSITLDELRPDEIALVHAYVAGLKASRTP